MNPLTHGFSGGSAVKNPPATQKIWIHFLGQEDPWEKGNSNPFQYSCLGNPMDRGASMRRAYKDYLRNGGIAGEGYGVFFAK